MYALPGRHCCRAKEHYVATGGIPPAMEREMIILGT